MCFSAIYSTIGKKTAHGTKSFLQKEEKIYPINNEHSLYYYMEDLEPLETKSSLYNIGMFYLVNIYYNPWQVPAAGYGKICCVSVINNGATVLLARCRSPLHHPH